ncbi:hypothetical protein CEXT_98331 [Caerostris extrusa]|uniref:Small ribosomal subunit protein mS26 n=1 Tax=Caerostris extrusa TaxID=172846 RepID=A0AAV4QL97_CAEEX|nr:hypothetical protein CEXT_98331 [Caerostris extrusa]
MSLFSPSCRHGILRFQESWVKLSSISIQLRWKKKPRTRKPAHIPMALGKMYKIPKHPYVPPEENELTLNLLAEYMRKIDSMRKYFKEELEQKYKDEGNTFENQKLEEVKFQALLDENNKENERLRKIR